MTGRPAYVIGVDIGSQSVRAAVVDTGGRIAGRSVRPISTATPAPLHYEQSTEEMWAAVVAAVREALAQGGVAPAQVKGIAFDATSSVALFDGAGRPASVSTTGDDRLNVVMWCDHRAEAEAAAIDATDHKVLRHIGGRMSPEMVLPKLLWLRRHLPQAWARYGLALDLTDYFAWRATGIAHASICTITCKWTFLSHEQPGWQDPFLAAIGLDHVRLKLRVPDAGIPVGGAVGRLSAIAAAELGLAKDCVVAAGVIDAHAGCMGPLAGLTRDRLDREIAVIGGTSTCLMALSQDPRYVPGVWGPYRDTLRPGLWLNEGGQSATGAALDHVLDWHAAGAKLRGNRHEAIVAQIETLQAAGTIGAVSKYLFVPDLNGNRSPLADPKLRGILSGLDLDASADSLVQLYLAAATGIALGTRHVIEALNRGGWSVERIQLVGGHARNRLLVHLYADATGCAVLATEDDDGVLLGDAILAAAAAGLFPDLPAAAEAMWRQPTPVRPEPQRRALLDRQYVAYRVLQESARGLA
jgi:FGGY-family pentulose kinase